MKKHVFLLSCLFSLFLSNGLRAQSESPTAYLESAFPSLTELFREDLSNYPAHYIFAVDVSGSMNRYQDVVAGALTPFFQALPDKDRVDVIPFGTEARMNMLGYSGVINSGVKNALCQNIRTLYVNDSYSKEFKAHTDIRRAVDAVAKVIQNNREYKVNIIVILTDFRNDQKGLGECKLKADAIKGMQTAISAATGDIYTRFIALELPVDRSKPGYCLNQLRDGVFSFDGHSLEIASIGNDSQLISQWFEQLKRDIMTTKLKAIVHDANRNAPVRLKVNKDIDGNVQAEVHWEPSRLYPTIKIDSSYVDSDGFYFVNNIENFTQTRDSVIKVELGQIKHRSYGFHNFDGNIHLGLTLPTEYDDELRRLEAEKPLPSTTVAETGWIFTFLMSLMTTAIILGLIILYIIGVIKAIGRNNSLHFKADVTFYDHLGNQLDNKIRVPEQPSSAVMTFGKGGSNRCSRSDADWQFIIEKKKGNPFLLFQKPRFVWRPTQKTVMQGRNSFGGNVGTMLVVSCGSSRNEITHKVKVQMR